jgi:hypothetical protein
MSGASSRSQMSSGDAREVSIHRRQRPSSVVSGTSKAKRLPVSVDHDVKHSARRVARREGESVRVVTPIRLVELDTMDLNVCLT